MQNHFQPLLRSIKILVDLITVYLFITWSYEGLSFLARSMFQ
jgi:hypothetical protein